MFFKYPNNAKPFLVSGFAMTIFKFKLTSYILIVFVVVSCTTRIDKSKSSGTSNGSIASRRDTSFNGLYVGLEKMCSIDSTGKKDCYSDLAKPQLKWYHLCYLRFRRDSVFLEQTYFHLLKRYTLFGFIRIVLLIQRNIQMH